MDDHKRMRLVLGVPALAMLLALGACGDHRGGVENTDMPVVERANVEPGRQGAESAAAEGEHRERRATAIMGGAPQVEAGGVAMDARIVDDVKKALQADTGLAAMNIDVSSQEGQVVLQGRAPDSAARERASQLARDVREVKSVDNLLTVG